VNKYRFKNVINFNKVTINIADVVGGQWTRYVERVTGMKPTM